MTSANREQVRVNPHLLYPRLIAAPATEARLRRAQRIRRLALLAAAISVVATSMAAIRHLIGLL